MRGAGATVFAQGVTLGVQVIGTVVLARLLTPAEFGVVAMVTTFSLILMSVGLNGFTEAVIQSEKIDRFTASNLFWLNSGTGLVLAIAFAASGSLLARFYGNPLVADVAVAISVAILIASGSVIHLALLKRAMRFGATSANDVVARAVYVVVAIVLALRGWGYWALVAGIVAQSLCGTIGAWWLCRWMPSLPRRTGRTVPVIRFAANVCGRFVAGCPSKNLDKVLVGWRFNAVALGFYKKAYDLFVLSESQLTGPLHNVALATLSRLNQDPVRFRRYLVNSLGIIAFVGMAVGANLTLVGKDVVRLVLGPQWGEAGRIFTFFGPGIALMVVYSTYSWIHLSIGRPDRWLRWTIIEFVVTVLLFIVGLHWGPEGIAVAWSASYCILIVPAFWYAGLPIQFGVSKLIAAVWKYAIASLAAGWSCAAIVHSTPFYAPARSAGAAFDRIIVVSVIFGALYLTAVILLHRGCAPLYQVMGLLRELVPVPRASSAVIGGATVAQVDVPVTPEGDEA